MKLLLWKLGSITLPSHTVIAFPLIAPTDRPTVCPAKQVSDSDYIWVQLPTMAVFSSRSPHFSATCIFDFGFWPKLDDNFPCNFSFGRILLSA